MKGLIEAATVFWYPKESKGPADGAKEFRERDRKFESVENAVTFVIEKLSATERGTSMIMTSSRSIYPTDMKGIYAGLKVGKSSRGVNRRALLSKNETAAGS